MNIFSTDNVAQSKKLILHIKESNFVSELLSYINEKNDYTFLFILRSYLISKRHLYFLQCHRLNAKMGSHYDIGKNKIRGLKYCWNMHLVFRFLEVISLFVWISGFCFLQLQLKPLFIKELVLISCILYFGHLNLSSQTFSTKFHIDCFAMYSKSRLNASINKTNFHKKLKDKKFFVNLFY